MNRPAERKRSRYMEWAKTCSTARFNLATSGLTNVLLSEFPVQLEELEITGGGYGYAPLLERIAIHTGASVQNIVTAEGTSMANHLAMAALLEPGDEVVLSSFIDAADATTSGVSSARWKTTSISPCQRWKKRSRRPRAW